LFAVFFLFLELPGMFKYIEQSLLGTADSGSNSAVIVSATATQSSTVEPPAPTMSTVDNEAQMVSS